MMQADGNRVKQRPAYKELKGEGSVAQQADEAWALTRSLSSSVIEDLFAGQLMSTLTCPDCGAQSHAFTEVLDLSLPLVTGRELNTIQVGSCSCLAEFILPSVGAVVTLLCLHHACLLQTCV